MTMAMIMVVISSGLSMLIASSAWVLAKQSGFDNEKMTPFECGFDPLKSARVPFSVRFFLLAILFLVFDVEIVLFLPVLGSLLLPNYSMLVGSIFFLFLVLVGLIYEWWEGALGWIS